MTTLGRKAITYLLNRPEHVLMIVETHLRDEPAQKVMNEMQALGWTPIMSPAAKAEDNDTGKQ